VSDLIAYRGTVPLPKNPAGAAWGDPTVESVARIADLLLPFQDRLGLTQADTIKDGLEFTGDVTLRWGTAEATDGKVTRLRDILAKPGTLPETIDLTR
jgi:hypothetical protein